MSLHHYAPVYLDRLTASMRAELSKGVGVPGAPHVHYALELSPTLPGVGQVTRRLAGVGGGSSSAGRHEGRVENWGTVSRGITARGCQLQALEVQITVADQPHTVEDSFTVLAAKYPSRLRRAPVVIRSLSPNVRYKDSDVVFSGILASWAPTSPWKWKLRLTADDTALVTGYFPRYTLSSADFPQIHGPVSGAIMPICYGRHQSDGQAKAGMVALPCVDTVGKRWFATLGVAQAIDAVWKGTTRLDTAAWTRVDAVVNGKAVTLVQVPSATPEDQISVDMRGLTERGDGTGELIRNPARQIVHWLQHFVWGSWSQGAYLPASVAPIDYQLFAKVERYFDERARDGYEGSKYVQGREPFRAKEFLDEWADSLECKPFWTRAGRLGALVLDPAEPVLPGILWIRGGEETSNFSITDDAGGLCTRVETQYVFGAAEGKYYQTLVVEDRFLPDDISVSRQQPWSAARVS